MTSLITPETPPAEIHALLAADAGTFLLRTQRLPAKFHGAGDTLAALFLFHTLSLGDPVRAAQITISSLAGLLHRTFAAGSAELLTGAEGSLRRLRSLLSELGDVPALPHSLRITGDQQEVGWQLCDMAPLVSLDLQRLLVADGLADRMALLAELCDAMSDDVIGLLSGTDSDG